jgi:hypothetical protein
MQFIIDFKNDVAQEAIDSYFAANGCTVKETYDSFEKVFVVEATSQPADDDIVDVIINDLLSPIQLLSYPVDSGDEYPNVSFGTATDDDWWKLASVTNPDFNKVTQVYERRGQTATVYIVDSGVMSGHPELQYIDVSHLYAFNGDIVDHNGHGTAIASVIGGLTCGIAAPRVKSVKIFQDGVTTLQSHILAALDAIIQDVALNPNTFPIVNLSWSIAKNTYIEDKIRLLIDAGVFVITAAGNGGQAIEDVTPAGMPEVCTVGAYGMNLYPCSFSNYTGDLSTTQGNTNHGAIDVWAPGEQIKIALLDGSTGHGAGTSLAAAIHTAAVAYNSYSAILSNGKVADILLDMGVSFLAINAGKKGILTLENQYANSVNVVSRFTTTYDGDDGTTYPNVSKFNGVAQTGVQFQRMMFNPLVVESYHIDGTLPPGLVIDNGWLTGTVNVSETTVFVNNVTYTKFSGMVVNSVLTIVVLANGDTVASSSNIDPEIKVHLQAVCAEVFSGGYYSCSGSCAVGGFCTDACDGPFKAPGETYCYCAGPVYETCP